jgi:predicted nicotinamide N-methyase
VETHLQAGRRETLNAGDFIRANTSVMAPPLVPEVRLHLAHEAVPLWQKTEEELGAMGLPPPFWAFAWAGGQALARHVLDHPQLVRGRRVIDLASGSGLVGLAALKAGATHVLAADIDRFAVAAIGLNAELNGWLMRYSSPHEEEGPSRSEGLTVTCDDLLRLPPPACDVILVGDLFYEKDLAARVIGWLTVAEGRETMTFIGDPSRSYLPREKLEKLAEYHVPVTRELEDAEIKRTAVWRLKRD